MVLNINNVLSDFIFNFLSKKKVLGIFIFLLDMIAKKMKNAYPDTNFGSMKKKTPLMMSMKVIKKKLKKVWRLMINLMAKILSKNFHYFYSYIFSQL